MNEQEITTLWDAERPIYEAWAKFVLDEICNSIATESITIDSFLKIAPKYRVKESKSLIDKALFRQKVYSNPYNDITDKVGMRFVVLLTKDIRTIEEIICKSDNWSYSKDKDFEDDRKAKPLEFAYQSVHYVVRAKHTIETTSVTIPENTPCEIQVRTLLQHAHSELTHDSIYKPQKTASPEIQRIVAKSMALIETTDDFFERVMDKLKEATIPERNALSTLERIYIEHIKLKPDVQKSNFLILDSFSKKLDDTLNTQLEQLLIDKPYIVNRIYNRAALQHLFRQPTILLTYLMVSKFPALAKVNWPLTIDELRPVYTDIGLSIDDY